MKFSIKRRNYILLEVLIALMLLSLCFVPIMMPYIMNYRSQQNIIESVKLDEIAAREFLNFKVCLYRHQIEIRDIPIIKSYKAIESGKGYYWKLDPKEIFDEDSRLYGYKPYFECFKMEKCDGQYCKIFVDMHFKHFFDNKSRHYFYQIAAVREDEKM